MDLQATYNKIAEAWHADHQSDDWWIEGTNKFIELVRKGGRVLDAGCAGGVKSRYLIDAGLRVTGIDLSENMVAIAKREVPQGTFEVMDLKDVRTLMERFDGIFLQAVLLHIPKAEAEDRVKRLSEVLKPGGYFYIAVKERQFGGPEEEVVEESDYGYPYERFFSYYTTEELGRYLKEAGCEVVYEDMFLSGRTRWIQVIGKKS